MCWLTQLITVIIQQQQLLLAVHHSPVYILVTLDVKDAVITIICFKIQKSQSKLYAILRTCCHQFIHFFNQQLHNS